MAESGRAGDALWRPSESSEGKYWAESIGLPGHPDYHFETRHVLKDRRHFVNGIFFVAPGEKTDLLGEMGLLNSKIFLGGQDAYDPKTEETHKVATTTLVTSAAFSSGDFRLMGLTFLWELYARDISEICVPLKRPLKSPIYLD